MILFFVLTAIILCCCIVGTLIRPSNTEMRLHIFQTVEKAKCWHLSSGRSELFIVLLNFDAMAGKINVAYE